MESMSSVGLKNIVCARKQFKFACFSPIPRPDSPLNAIQRLNFSRSRGFSLLELLISLLIFAIGFLGLVSLQHLSFRLTQDTVLQSTAMTLADNLVEQLKVNKPSSIEGSWQKSIEDSLPNAQATLVKQGEYFDIKVQWLESQFSEELSNTQTLELSFRAN